MASPLMLSSPIAVEIWTGLLVQPLDSMLLETTISTIQILAVEMVKRLPVLTLQPASGIIWCMRSVFLMQPTKQLNYLLLSHVRCYPDNHIVTTYSVFKFIAQSRYLSFLEFTNDTATSGTLPPCQNCTVAINIPGNGFPFGSYYHSMVYVRQNLISSTHGILYYHFKFHVGWYKRDLFIW